MDRIQNPTLDSAKTGVATIVSALVHTLAESDPTFQERFLKRLSQAAYSRKNSTLPWDLDEVEIINWTSEFITGWSGITGQGDPLYTGD
jgi:hypothetical protein